MDKVTTGEKEKKEEEEAVAGRKERKGSQNERWRST